MSDTTNFGREEEEEEFSREENEETSAENDSWERSSVSGYSDDEDEDEEELTEEPEEVHASHGGLKVALVAFILLFLLSTGMLVYYQFYQGHGHWNVSLVHKANTHAEDEDAEEAQAQLMDSMQAKIDSLIIMANNPPKQTGPQASYTSQSNDGTWYEVQIGAFQNFSLNNYQGTLNGVNQESANGLNKLTLGRFNDFNAADNFRKDMQKIGIRKAWVVKKMNGNRVPFDPKTEM